VNGPVLALAASCDTIYIGGSFSAVGGQARANLAAVNFYDGALTSWNPGADGAVLSLSLAGNTLYAGGQFNQIAGQSRPYLARMDVVTGAPDYWRPRPSFAVSTIWPLGNNILAGGNAVGMARKNLAALDVMTGKPAAWNPAPDGSVYAIAMHENTLYIGGDFLNVAGQSRHRLAAIDRHTGAALEWKPNVDGFERANAVVESIVVSRNTVFVSGSFTNINGQTRLHLAALDRVTGQLLAWNPGANDDVRTLRLSGNTLYAGGRFTEVGGRFRRRLAAIDVLSGSVLPWNPMADDAVRALEISDDAILAGGLFSAMQNFGCSRLARLDAVTGLPDSWRPEAANTNYIGPYELTSYANTITSAGVITFIGGLFNRIGGEPRHNLALIDAVTGRALDWHADADQPVIAKAFSRDTLYVGGVFRNIGGDFHPNFAVFPPAGAPHILQHPANRHVAINAPISVSAAVQGTAPLAYRWQRNGTDVPGANSTILSISAASVNDSGEYVLVASNSLGMISSRPSIVTVTQALTIVTHPASQTKIPGSTVTLGVEVTGHPFPTYQWRINEVNIPGATGPTLTITNAQPVDGGSYDVVAANLTGAINSQPAKIIVTSPALPFADNFAESGLLVGSAGVGSGNNTLASKEPFEPRHANKRGGKSVWVGWTAPDSGIATFSTRGSDFDTLLGIYTADLQPVFSDEDRGGFLTSRASFNAVAQAEYLIAVDGFAGSNGNIVVTWELDTNTVAFPYIQHQPSSQTVRAGERAEFSVGVLSLSDERYQWFFKCESLPGQVNSTLIISNVGPENLGPYRVLVMNASSHIAESAEVFLEIGPEPVISRSKFGDVLEDLGAAAPAPGFFSASALASSAGNVLVVRLGTIASQLLNNSSSNASASFITCGSFGGNARYLALRVTQTGTLQVDTIGSQVDTLLAIYSIKMGDYRTLRLVDCNDNGAPGREWSLLRTNAQGGYDYLLVAAGKSSTEGNVNINWKLGGPPIPLAVTNVSVGLGAPVTLRANVSSDTDDATYQWLRDGMGLAGQTNETLAIGSLQQTNAGRYEVIVRNFAGVITNAVTRLIPLGYRASVADGNFHLLIPSTRGYVIQSSTNFIIWQPIYTNNSSTDSPLEVLDRISSNSQLRVYRLWFQTP
jgi:hypothetical protein